MKKLIAIGTSLLLTMGILTPSKMQLTAQEYDYYVAPASEIGREYGSTIGLITIGVAVVAAAAVVIVATNDSSSGSSH